MSKRQRTVTVINQVTKTFSKYLTVSVAIYLPI